MGYGKEKMSGRHNIPGLGSAGMGKASEGGVKLEKSIGKISESQDDVLSGKETQMEDSSMAKAGVVSGSHSKGKFMAAPKYKSHGTSKAMPDFPDVDKDGNTTESIKSASAGTTKIYGGNKGDESSKTKAKVKAIVKDAKKDYMKK